MQKRQVQGWPFQEGQRVGIGELWLELGNYGDELRRQSWCLILKEEGQGWQRREWLSQREDALIGGGEVREPEAKDFRRITGHLKGPRGRAGLSSTPGDGRGGPALCSRRRVGVGGGGGGV